MDLGHLLTRSGLKYLAVSSKVYHVYFCQFGSSISLPWVIYFEAYIKFREKSVKWEPSCSLRTERDGQTHMRKLIAAFQSFEKAPNGYIFSTVFFINLIIEIKVI